MNCMKCGQEINAGQVFCDDCLALMEKYPVRPDVAVVLPARSEGQQPRKTVRHRRAPGLEEQIALLKKKNRRLLLSLVFALIVIGLLSFTVGTLISELDVQRFLGQNYTTVETTESTMDSTVPSEPSGAVTRPDA